MKESDMICICLPEFNFFCPMNMTKMFTHGEELPSRREDSLGWLLHLHLFIGLWLTNRG
jgi:hypothetical protein